MVQFLNSHLLMLELNHLNYLKIERAKRELKACKLSLPERSYTLFWWAGVRSTAENKLSGGSLHTEP